MLDEGRTMPTTITAAEVIAILRGLANNTVELEGDHRMCGDRVVDFGNVVSSFCAAVPEIRLTDLSEYL
jgi:hypothetical protein